MTESEQDLLVRTIEGQLKPEEHQNFSDLIKNNEEARQHYLQQCKVDGLLKATHGQLVEKQHFEPTPIPRTTPWHWMALAALLLISITLWNFPHNSITIETLNPGPVARVIEANENRFSKGMQILPGDLSFDQGKLHLVMDSGVEMIISGPSRFRLDHAMKVHLNSGKASVKVPPVAQGFKLTTDTMSILDLGTSFGVDASTAKHEVHVFEGKVKVVPASLMLSQDTVVNAGEAMSIEQNKDDFQNSTYLQKKFERNFYTPQPINTPYVHYKFNQNIQDSGTHRMQFDGLVLGNIKNNFELPWAKGKFDQALLLNRKYWLQTAYTGVSGSLPRTVSLWIKVLPGQTFKSAAAILAWGHGKNSQKKWQIMLDGSAQGTLRVSLGDGHISGSTDLQDGRWHHICAVYLGGKDADVRTHLRLYVDGKLEPIQRARLQSVNTGNEQPMVIGQNLTHFDKKEHIFKGLIDELYIFEEALHPNQINLLFQHNSLPQKEAF